jgi:hypothetical protein
MAAAAVVQRKQVAQMEQDKVEMDELMISQGRQ